MSQVSVCTLFEGHYHYGVAALINSLYKNGYEGEIFVGYRGDLPFWAKGSIPASKLLWEGASTFSTKMVQVHFLPISTTRHLTNYKPAFMLTLRQYITNGMFYIDPDIMIKCKWAFFEEWIEYGVALCQEIVWNNFSPNNPKRKQWEKILIKFGYSIERPLSVLFNGGFCGLNISSFEFAAIWEEIIDKGITEGLFDSHHFTKAIEKTNIFSAGDQDALNMAAMACQLPISDVGPEGMDFIPGGWLMSHATGSPKPWKKNYLLAALKGFPPTMAEKTYWMNANGIIKTYTGRSIWLKQLSIKWASFIGRFYKRY